MPALAPEDGVESRLRAALFGKHFEEAAVLPLILLDLGQNVAHLFGIALALPLVDPDVTVFGGFLPADGRLHAQPARHPQSPARPDVQLILGSLAAQLAQARRPTLGVPALRLGKL